MIYADEKLDPDLGDLSPNGSHQHTVFAPTDAAFKAFNKVLDIGGKTDLTDALGVIHA